jgi:hypothetical protein
VTKGVQLAQDKLQLLKALDEAGAASRRRAAWSAWALVGASLVVLAVIVYVGARQIDSARRTLADVEAAAQVEQKKLADAKTEELMLSAEIARLKPLVENYREAAAGESAAALSIRPQSSVQSPVPVTPPGARVYLQIVDQRDREYAVGIGADLAQHDFKVMGVEYVPKAARLKNTEVRYYKKADEPGAERLLEAIHTAGAKSAVLLYLGLENDTRVRPNHYEVWFAAQNRTPDGQGAR